MESLAEPQVHLWNRREYYLMGEAGMFAGKHVELIEGRVIEMSPIGSEQATCVTLVNDQLKSIFAAKYFIRVQNPLDFGDYSEPEPDVAVIEGKVRDYAKAHPTTAVLVVEVADTSLAYDGTEKASLYAKAGMQEYWIVNLKDRRLEVRRTPIADASQPFEFGYKEIILFGEIDSVAPLAAPHASISVSDVLP